MIYMFTSSPDGYSVSKFRTKSDALSHIEKLAKDWGETIESFLDKHLRTADFDVFAEMSQIGKDEWTFYLEDGDTGEMMDFKPVTHVTKYELVCNLVV